MGGEMNVTETSFCIQIPKRTARSLSGNGIREPEKAKDYMEGKIVIGLSA
jgi:hypothetical protein